MSHPYPHFFPSNPYLVASPPPVAHKVWILDCKNCSMFLTNRGMKAVLLLRPNVSLYSSDVLPVNCSPYDSTDTSDALWSPTDHKSSMPSRTCECLTQPFCCHGCGNSIGYMIIVPCFRCTSSSSVTNRSTNGHRFVFQASEVLGIERRYIPNEKGIIPFDPTEINAASLFRPDAAYPAPHLNLYRAYNPAGPYGQMSPTDSLSPPALEYTNILDYSQQRSEHDSWAYPDTREYPSPSQPRASYSPIPVHVHPHYHPVDYATSLIDARSHPSLNFSSTSDQKYPPTTVPILKAGDVIFWHHLARSVSGKILGAVDDERARRPAEESAGRGMGFDR